MVCDDPVECEGFSTYRRFPAQTVARLRCVSTPYCKNDSVHSQTIHTSFANDLHNETRSSLNATSLCYCVVLWTGTPPVYTNWNSVSEGMLVAWSLLLARQHEVSHSYCMHEKYNSSARPERLALRCLFSFTVPNTTTRTGFGGFCSWLALVACIFSAFGEAECACFLYWVQRGVPPAEVRARTGAELFLCVRSRTGCLVNGFPEAHAHKAHDVPSAPRSVRNKV